MTASSTPKAIAGTSSSGLSSTGDGAASALRAPRETMSAARNATNAMMRKGASSLSASGALTTARRMRSRTNIVPVAVAMPAASALWVPALLRAARAKLAVSAVEEASPREEADHQETEPRARKFHRDVARKRDGRHEHHHPPQNVRVEHLARAVALVRQERQDDDGDEKEANEGDKLFVLDARDEAVHALFHFEQRHRHDARRRRERHVAAHREGAEREGEKRRDVGGDAVILLGACARALRHDQERGHAQKREAQHEIAEHLAERAPHPAQEPDQREGADARDALAFFGRALLPAALEPDDEADAERHGQALEELLLRHAGAP